MLGRVTPPITAWSWVAVILPLWLASAEPAATQPATQPTTQPSQVSKSQAVGLVAGAAGFMFVLGLGTVGAGRYYRRKAKDNAAMFLQGLGIAFVAAATVVLALGLLVVLK